MHVIEHKEIQTAIDRRSIGRNIRLDGLEPGRCGLVRQVDQGEGRDLLWPAILEYLEVLVSQVCDEPIVLVRDDRVDFDVIDFESKGLRRPLLSGQRPRQDGTRYRVGK